MRSLPPKRVLVTTHVRPDGDALGTSAAMVLAMRKMNIAAQVLLLSRLPNKYSFVFAESGIVHYDAEAGWPATLNLADFDALLVVDTGTWSQLPGLKERIAGWNAPKLVVDHHLTQEDWADAKLVVTEAAAAGEIAAELLDRWNVPLDKSIAAAVFLAIVSDTGWFQFSNTRPYTLRLAARLIEAGVDTDRMYQVLYQNERAQRLALADPRSAIAGAAGRRPPRGHARPQERFRRNRANVGDTENLINIPLQVRTVEVSLLMVEPLDAGPIRISLRSKGQIDVANFAEQFGGGGHAAQRGSSSTQRLMRRTSAWSPR